jgi:hypothetical protein
LKLPAASTGDVHEETLAEVGLKILPSRRRRPSRPTGWALVPYVIGSVAETSDDEVVGSDLLLDLRGNMETDAGVAVEVTPAAVKLGLVATADGELVLSAVPASPWVLIGAEQGHRLELGGVRVRVRVAGSAAAPQFGIELDTTNLPGGRRFALVLDTAEADSFLSRIIGSDPRRVEFSLKLGWSSGRGFEFAAGGTVAFDVPFAVSFPGVQAEGRLAFAIGADQAGLIADATIDVASQLGPLGLAIAGVGARLRLVSVPPDTGGGSFGDVDISLGLQGAGPGGVVDPQRPGGRRGIPLLRRTQQALRRRPVPAYLRDRGERVRDHRDDAAGWAAGVLVRDPDLGAVHADSHRTGVHAERGGGAAGDQPHGGHGGAAGLGADPHPGPRAVPEAPEKNALEILASLRGLFPAAEGRFTFGPMAIIGWGGTIPVLEAEIGLILELPEPIRLTILGQVRAGLPDKDKAFVKLNFDAVGVLDFERKTFSLDASLYESNVGGFPISGDMALRLSWGNPPNFVLSIGGFHPQFQPPPGIPALQRVQVALGQNGNPRITIQGTWRSPRTRRRSGRGQRCWRSRAASACWGGSGSMRCSRSSRSRSGWTSAPGWRCARAAGTSPAFGCTGRCLDRTPGTPRARHA